MKWHIISIGKPSLSYAKSGIEEYSKRLHRYVTLEMSQQKDTGQEKNSRFLLDASEGAIRIALDERGEKLTTRDFAARTEFWQNSGTKKIAFLIGGADGHSQEVRDRADQVWSLSGLTLQHELALVVLLEQIYRVQTFLKGEPYHRE